MTFHRDDSLSSRLRVRLLAPAIVWPPRRTRRQRKLATLARFLLGFAVGLSLALGAWLGG